MSITRGGALTCRTFREGVSEMTVHHPLWAPGILVPLNCTLQRCHSDHGARTARGTRTFSTRVQMASLQPQTTGFKAEQTTAVFVQEDGTEHGPLSPQSEPHAPRG